MVYLSECGTFPVRKEMLRIFSILTPIYPKTYFSSLVGIISRQGFLFNIGKFVKEELV